MFSKKPEGNLEKKAIGFIKRALKKEPIIKWGDGKSYLEIRNIFWMLYQKNDVPYVVERENRLRSGSLKRPLTWYVRLLLDIAADKSLKLAHRDFRWSTKFEELWDSGARHHNDFVDFEEIVDGVLLKDLLRKKNRVIEFKKEVEALLKGHDLETDLTESVLKPALIVALKVPAR